MKYVLLIALFIGNNNLKAQFIKDISLKSNFGGLYSRFSSDGFKQLVQQEQNPVLDFVSLLSKKRNIYVGIGVGYGKFSFNNYNGLYEQFNEISFNKIHLVYRKEDYAGRRNRFFYELAIEYKNLKKFKQKDAAGHTANFKNIGYTIGLSGFGGYQYVFTDHIKFDAGVNFTEDFFSTVNYNNSHMYFSTASLMAGIHYAF